MIKGKTIYIIAILSVILYLIFWGTSAYNKYNADKLHDSRIQEKIKMICADKITEQDSYSNCIATQNAYEEEQERLLWLHSRDMTAYEIVRFIGCIFLAMILFAIYSYLRSIYG